MRLFFFFQAEDGIRDLVRSRGLGDVYKRQPCVSSSAPGPSPMKSQSGLRSPTPSTACLRCSQSEQALQAATCLANSCQFSGLTAASRSGIRLGSALSAGSNSFLGAALGIGRTGASRGVATGGWLAKTAGFSAMPDSTGAGFPPATLSCYPGSRCTHSGEIPISTSICSRLRLMPIPCQKSGRLHVRWWPGNSLCAGRFDENRNGDTTRRLAHWMAELQETACWHG